VQPVQYVFKSPSIPRWEHSREYTSKMKRLFPKMKRVTKTLPEPETKQEMSKRQLMQRNASKKEVQKLIFKGEQPSDLTRNESFVLLGVVLVLTIAVSHMEKVEISVPISVTALWLTVAFLLGYIVSEKRQTTRKEHHEKEELARQKAVLLAGAKEPVKDDSVPSDFSSVLMNYEEPEQIEACDLLKERTLKYTSTDGSTLNQLIRLIGSEMFLSDRPEEELWKDKLLLRFVIKEILYKLVWNESILTIPHGI
jgi:Ca2+/Na+ antiporter